MKASNKTQVNWPQPFMDGRHDMVNPLIARYALEEVALRGHDPAALLDGLGCTVHDFQQPDFRLSYVTASDILWRVCRLLDDPDLGLVIGERHNLIAWGLVGFGAMASANLRDAITFGLRYQEEAGALLALRFKTEEPHTSLIASPRFADVRIERILVDGIFAALVKAARHIFGAHFRPSRVDLVTAPVASLARYDELFRCPVSFRCAENRMVVDLKTLSEVTTFANTAAWRTADDTLRNNRVNPQAHSSMRVAVMRVAEAHLRAPLSPAQTAALLGLGERTLRRRLAQEGTSYLNILDMARRTRALELLLLAERPASEVAAELGFASARSLDGAIKRWLGHALFTAG